MASDSTRTICCLGSACRAFCDWVVTKTRRKEEEALTLEISLQDMTTFGNKPLPSSTPIGLVPDDNFFNLCSISRIYSSGDPFGYSWGEQEVMSFYDETITAQFDDRSVKLEMEVEELNSILDDTSTEHWFDGIRLRFTSFSSESC